MLLFYNPKLSKMHRLSVRSSLKLVRKFSAQCRYLEETVKPIQQPTEADLEAIHTKIRSLDYSCRSLLVDIQNTTRSARQESVSNRDAAREAFIQEIKSVDDELTHCLELTPETLKSMLENVQKSNIDEKSKTEIANLVTSFEGIRMTSKILHSMISTEKPQEECQKAEESYSLRHVFIALIVLTALGITPFL